MSEWDIGAVSVAQIKKSSSKRRRQDDEDMEEDLDDIVDEQEEEEEEEEDDDDEDAAQDDDDDEDPAVIRNEFREFLRNYKVGAIFLYRDKIISHYRSGEAKVDVSLDHLLQYRGSLLNSLVQNPTKYHPLLEEAAKEVLRLDSNGSTIDSLPDIQVILESSQQPVPLREISSNDINHLVRVPGIIISATRTRSKVTSMVLTCKDCHLAKTVKPEGTRLPDVCPDCKARNSMTVMPDRGEYVDAQTLKLQEAPEVVPTGEMPRTMLVSVERNLVDAVSPGTRVDVVGIITVINNTAGGSRRSSSGGARTLYLKALGIHVQSENSGRMREYFTPEEESEFQELSRDEHIYEKIVRSIAPAISGDYTEDIKKAIACLLFGGSRKLLPDGMKIRGDINVLLLGDPSTAKSQFLKFVEQVAPIGVYTSGKGSSAAGLTASVIRDSRGEFYLEGGAMVLADGGVVCIDEFDKMREQDRVAIHEAMEQQTISIAKAGITTILNSRTSVLAAANPVFGTYNDFKSAAENIDFLPTILSRFDLIFIVRDVRDEYKDKTMARHVMDIHMGGGSGNKNVQNPTIVTEIPNLKLKKYIAYARSRCAPTLTQAAAALLQNHYVNVREQHRRRSHVTRGATIPITVRQLEALVRVAESLAKMQLSRETREEHVAEAIRLFQVSTWNAANTGADTTQSLQPELQAEVRRIEDQIKRKIPVGNTASIKNLQDDLTSIGFPLKSVMKAIQILLVRDEFIQFRKGHFVKRLR